MKNFCLVSLFFLLLSCHDKEREQKLSEREQALELRESSFIQKEAEYRSLLKMRDSLIAARDSIIPVRPWPDSIAGKWSSKLVCTESSCSDYVIGDQRTYIWEFGNDSTRLVTKVLDNKDELIRQYNASYSSQGIRLTFKTDSTASKSVFMDTELTQIRKGRIKGVHTISFNNDCTARFSVELTRLNPGK